MTRPSVSLRPAQSTLEEGRACARYLDEAAEGFFRILLGRRAVEILAQAYVQPGNEYSYEHAIFAERDGRIVGLALGFTAEQRRGFPANPLARSHEYPRVRAGIVRFLMGPMIRVLDTVPDGDFYLLSLAIDGDHRGQGIGSALMEAMAQRALGIGAKRFALDVAVKNEGARRLYERHGLAVESKWPKRLNLGSLGLLRMAKPLRSI